MKCITAMLRIRNRVLRLIRPDRRVSWRWFTVRRSAMMESGSSLEMSREPNCVMLEKSPGRSKSGATSLSWFMNLPISLSVLEQNGGVSGRGRKSSEIYGAGSELPGGSRFLAAGAPGNWPPAASAALAACDFGRVWAELDPTATAPARGDHAVALKSS